MMGRLRAEGVFMSSATAFTITLDSRFDFSCMNRFREQYEIALANPNIKDIIVDFSAVQYLDSSAMGMLMLLREKADKQKQVVQLEKVSGLALELLSIARFDRLFAINQR